MTDYAMKLIVADLETLRSSGNEPNAVLKQSIKRGWLGVFALRGGTAEASGDAAREEARQLLFGKKQA